MARILVLLLMTAAVVASFSAPAALNFREPELARIVFFHLPCALLCGVGLVASLVCGIGSLSKRTPEWDVRFAASWELSTLLAVLALVTGMIFSRVQWGAWWQWDPRQTSFLLVTLLLGAGLLLRAGLSDPPRRAAASAGYAVLTFLPMAFLFYVFPRLPHVRQISSHPSTVIAEGGLDATYRGTLYLCFFALAVVVVGMWRRRVAVGLLELKWDERYANLGTDRGGATGPRLRGPVVVPVERGPAD